MVDFIFQLARIEDRAVPVQELLRDPDAEEEAAADTAAGAAGSSAGEEAKPAAAGA